MHTEGQQVAVRSGHRKERNYRDSVTDMTCVYLCMAFSSVYPVWCVYHLHQHGYIMKLGVRLCYLTSYSATVDCYHCSQENKN